MAHLFQIKSFPELHLTSGAYMDIVLYIPGAHLTSVLIGKDLVGGQKWRSPRLGIYFYIYIMYYLH